MASLSIATLGLFTLLAPAQTLEPVSLTVGLKLGSYRPGVDGGVDGGTPYRDLFGTGGALIAEPQLRLLRDFGFLEAGLAFSAGWFTDTAYAFVDDGVDGGAASGGDRTGGETNVRVNPFTVALSARFLGVARWIDLPLVPYVEVGPSYALWRIGRGSSNDPVHGATFGWAVNAGLSLRLEMLEPASARLLKAEFGVASTELTFEYSRLMLDDFGRADAFDVSHGGWRIGLALGW